MGDSVRLCGNSSAGSLWMVLVVDRHLYAWHCAFHINLTYTAILGMAMTAFKSQWCNIIYYHCLSYTHYRSGDWRGWRSQSYKNYFFYVVILPLGVLGAVSIEQAQDNKSESGMHHTCSHLITYSSATWLFWRAGIWTNSRCMSRRMNKAAVLEELTISSISFNS